MARSKYIKNPEVLEAAADEFSADESSSKSARKRESEALKALGMQLAKLSTAQLREMQLEERLLKAITDYQHITSNGARRRQRGYIGGLLRDLGDEAEAVRARYTALTEHDANAKRTHHELEVWRERLIADDSALTEFLNMHQSTSAQELRTMIRRARTARDSTQRKLATRALYRKLADIVQA